MEDISSLNGISWLSITFYIILLLLFKSRFIGFFDPLNFFLIMRVAPLLATSILLSMEYRINNYLILLIISCYLFIAAFYFSTPSEKITKGQLKDQSIYYIFYFSTILLCVKILILSIASGDIPLFSDGGSDSYIAFDESNKLGSSFLLGIGAGDVVLLSFVIPLLPRYRLKALGLILLLLAITIGLAGGKKSSALNIFLAISLGEYLRLFFLKKQKNFFINFKIILVCLTMTVLWAIWVYSRTLVSDMTTMPEVDSIRNVLDFVFYQWAYAYTLFASGELQYFFESYQVNRATYFLHSILSPLGFPSFRYSVGPSIHEFLYGSITGNGINPTFIIEGYVLVGWLLPVYAVLVGFLIGKIRFYLFKISRMDYKIVTIALVLPALYVLPVDSLLFFKIVWINCFLLFLFMASIKFNEICK